MPREAVCTCEGVIMDKIIDFLKAQEAAEEAGQEEFVCPLCGGKAWWGRSDYNGHLHCGCQDCNFRLME